LPSVAKSSSAQNTIGEAGYSARRIFATGSEVVGVEGDEHRARAADAGAERQRRRHALGDEQHLAVLGRALTRKRQAAPAFAMLRIEALRAVRQRSSARPTRRGRPW
jgi:hypothetical protein